MRVLITGVTGFVGSHLAEFALAQGAEVHGLSRMRSRTEHIEELVDRITLHEADLTDAASIRRSLEESRPEWIFHLAAQSFVPTSWRAPAATIDANVIGQVNLYEAIRELGLDPVIQVAGSSEEYGLVHPDEVPIKESNPIRPLSPYAVSKVAQELLALQYFHSYGTRSIVTRGFNHTGPRRGEMFVTSNFAKQLAEIEAGLREPVLHVGNLEARRDWTDVRDMVRAYWLACEKATPGEVYNVGQGHAYRVREMLDMLLAESRVKVEVRPDPARMRPSDVELLLGDSSKFRQATGWEPQIPFEKTMADLFQYWRDRIGQRRSIPV